MIFDHITHLGFRGSEWQRHVDVASFISDNYTEYTGDDSFLGASTKRTDTVWEICRKLLAKEQQKGMLAVDTKNMSGINNFKPGYISKKDEVIVGLQTDKPLKRIVNFYGGLRTANNALKAYGLHFDRRRVADFAEFRKTHNEGVYHCYTPDILNAKKQGLITGLPDAYGRGRIIGDYRRIALYGVDVLMAAKRADWIAITDFTNECNIRLKEEVAQQYLALGEMKAMASSYGYDISLPAHSAKEAIQWTYFGYLAGIKENNGAAMSIGRVSTFFDIYIERDLQSGALTELQAQELIDQFVIKLRLVRHLRTPSYDEIFAGDPTWVTESIGGMRDDSHSLVTKTSFRILHTLINLGASPEPNLTVLWSNKLPATFRKYCAKISILTDSIQYEGDDVMRPIYGQDYGIACCVSAMKMGKQMQFFGARCNIAKALLYSINGGTDELSGKRVLDGIAKNETSLLDYEQVKDNFYKTLNKTAALYVGAMNIIHYNHDKYAYEKSLMALHDTDPEALMAFGIAGLSVATDSLSAIKHARVTPVRDDSGKVVEYDISGDFPKYGNDDDRVDDIAVDIVRYFMSALKKHTLYKNAKHTLSVLTITSNVMYGTKTGSTPDGRKRGEPFAPGANPMHGRDSSGALASLNSVAKIPYAGVCLDGISNTFSIVPAALGKTESERIDNLVSIIDGYFLQGAQHLNVNVLDSAMLVDAMQNPAKYPNLTIRVSGYAVHFNRLSPAQQREVITRTFHAKI